MPSPVARRKKVFRTVCLRDPGNSSDHSQVDVITAAFKADNYNMKTAFAEAAVLLHGKLIYAEMIPASCLKKSCTAPSVAAACSASRACGGASTEATPVTTSNNTGSSASVQYTGTVPPATTGYVQAFKLAVWDNLASQNRCGACHGSGGQAPTFVDGDDINQAYDAAITVVDLASPGQFPHGDQGRRRS